MSSHKGYNMIKSMNFVSKLLLSFILISFVTSNVTNDFMDRSHNIQKVRSSFVHDNFQLDTMHRGENNMNKLNPKNNFDLISFTENDNPESLAEQDNYFINTGDINLILYMHNFYRETPSNPFAKNMKTMSWNNTLQTYAQNWANQCIWAHGGIDPGMGQNLYAISVNNNDWVSAVLAWGQEGSYFNYSNIVYDHYTQIIWDSSLTVGCFNTFCNTITNLPWPNGGTIYVCDYYPAGNYFGQKPYQPGPLTTLSLKFSSSNIMSDITYAGGNVYAINSSKIIHQSTGTAWNPVFPGILLDKISVSPDGCIWGIRNGFLRRYASGVWTTYESYIDVFATSCNDAMLLTIYGQILTFQTRLGSPLACPESSSISGTIDNLWLITRTTHSLIRGRNSLPWQTVLGSNIAKVKAQDLANVCIVTNDGYSYVIKAGVLILIGTGVKDCATANGVNIVYTSSGDFWQST